MPDEMLAACKYCGKPGVIVAFRAIDHLMYQGRCVSCGQVAVENTNYDRAVDFWQSWQAQREKPELETMPEDDEAQEVFDLDLAPEPAEEPEPEDDQA